jgi:hypothetical protein
MSNPNYTLEVISHHPTFQNKSLRKYHVDGIDTVGAWGDEPFEILFKNNTYQKVQVKISVDGTDVLSGELATTEPTSNMWVVNGYGTLSLKAWPETNNGGAQLVFTSGRNSVALNTHGDLSNRGIIAAAVFTEGHVEPVKLNPNINIYPNYWTYPYYPYWYNGITLTGGISYNGDLSGNVNNNYYGNSDAARIGSAGLITTTTGGARTSTCNNTGGITGQSSASLDSNYFCNTDAAASLETLVSVGAGQHVEQNISYVAGLIKPLFSETVRVRYLWWDDLVAKLRSHNVPVPHPSGFPGNAKQNNINLGNTPRIGETSKSFFPREKPAPIPIQSYLRV